MQLYLIRHAHAIDGPNDAERPLSPKGREQIKHVAGFLRERGQFSPVEFWHSPLIRAVETAELFAQHLHTKVPRREVAGLTPEDEPHTVVRQLAAAPESLAIVGHEPHLSALASLLVTGRASPPVFQMKKCSVLALEGAPPHWIVCWQISASLLDSKDAGRD
jgi:phosphohistidine phosphatase